MKKYLAFDARRLKVFLLCLSLLTLTVIAAHALWKPGLDVTDGSHDKKQNAMWLQHGWIGDNAWFKDNKREPKQPLFRSEKSIHELNAHCEKNNIRDLYLHLCPTRSDGSIMAVDDVQLERFLTLTPHLRIMPWIGGVFGKNVKPDDRERSQKFMASVRALFKKHPRLAGVHLNVEPWFANDSSMLRFLDELRQSLPKAKILSLAAYTPTSGLNPYVDLQWNKEYFQAVAARCDQMAVMMYDVSLRDPKLFQWLVTRWSRDMLEWTKGTKTQVLLGVATYKSDETGRHDSQIENLETGLLGIHRALSRFDTLPANYQGIAIYCEWETDEAEWAYWHEHFASHH